MLLNGATLGRSYFTTNNLTYTSCIRYFSLVCLNNSIIFKHVITLHDVGWY